jgi:phosphatidylglycerophosphatase A
MTSTLENQTSAHTKKGSSAPTKPLWAWIVATYFGAGTLKPGPGTWGSAGAVITWAVIAHRLPTNLHTAGAIAFATIATLVGIPAATLTARACRRDDPSHVVIDEVAGQMVTLIAAPLTWKAQLAGFILFRMFDIMKPWPIRRLERLPEGTGIMLDDLGAGVFGWICLQLLLRSGGLS